MKKAWLQVDPLQGSILKGMILFALPIMATAFLQVLFSSVDTMVVGKFGSENAMAAVGASASIINLIISGVTSFSTGISTTVGYRYGKGNFDEIRPVIQSLPLTAFAIGTVVTILANLFWEPLLTMVRCPETLFPQAASYFRIYFCALPFMLIFSFLSAVLHAKGQSTQPFVIQVLCSIVNLGLNLLFVITLHWDVVGVAVATVISQAMSAVLVVLYFLTIEKELPLRLKGLTAFINMKEIFRLGIPTSMEGMVMNLSGVVISSAINGYPEYVISGNTVASSIEGLMCVAFIGFSSGSVVFTSQNFGKGSLERVRKVERTTGFSVFLLGECLGVMVFLFSPFLIGLYTDSRQITEISRLRMLFMCLPFGLCGTMNSLSGCIRGLGDTKTPLKISLLTSCGFRILWVCTVAKWIGSIWAIYISYPICWGLTTLLFIISFERTFDNKMKLEAGIDR